MSVEIVLDLVRVGHMMAFAVGMGAAAFIEIAILREFPYRIDRESMRLLRRGHRLIGSAVAGLWATGLALIALKLGVMGAPVTVKLAAKLLVVATLTGNMFLIGRFVLPTLSAQAGRSIGAMAPPVLARLGAIGGLSAAAWGSALLLGGVGVFQAMTAAQLAAIFLGLLTVGATAGMVVAIRLGQTNPARSLGGIVLPPAE